MPIRPSNKGAPFSEIFPLNRVKPIPSLSTSVLKLISRVPAVELIFAPAAWSIVEFADNVRVDAALDVFENPAFIEIWPEVSPCPMALRESLRPAFSILSIFELNILP